MKAVFDYLKKLYYERKQVSLLSWFYGAAAIVFIFIAGLCALVNQSFGVALLIVPIVALIALCANVTVWALVKLGIQHLEELDHVDAEPEIAENEPSKTEQKSEKKSAKKSESKAEVKSEPKTSASKTKSAKK